MTPDLTIVGLTGGIASGKSTVAGFLREAGVPVVDADRLGKIVLEKGNEAFDPLVEAFGRDILGESGEIDRKKLGAKVFDNKAKRAKLEAITHPAIARLAKRGMELIAERGSTLAIYEAALLVETGIYKSLSALVVVSCPVEMQLERLVARDGFTRDAAAARIASQFPLVEKVTVADYVIDTTSTLEETRSETLKVLSKIKDRFGLTDAKGK
jgi:dephospho-CoA kinase